MLPFSFESEKLRRTLSRKENTQALSIVPVHCQPDANTFVNAANYEFDQDETNISVDEVVDGDSNQGISSEVPRSNHPNTLNFHVGKFIAATLDVGKHLPCDSNTPFCERSTEGVHTKANFLFQLRNLAAKHNLSMTSLSDILILLETFSNGFLQLGVKRNRNGEYVMDMSRYLPTDLRDYPVHICSKGCCSFFDTSIKCKACGSWRYTKCKQCKSQECNPFDENREIYHGPSQRIARRSYYYRSLIILIQELLQWNLENREMDLFEYSTLRKSGVNSIDDVLDGYQAKRFLKTMNLIFQEYTETNKRNDLIEISLLLSDFYDGGNLFERNSLSIWPLIIEILNCLPTDRCKSGVGQHLIALHHMKAGSVAERELFSELYIPELLTLQQGLVLSVFHDGTTYNYFVQARVIVHRLDTRAFEKMAMVQCAPSKAGCSLCNSLKGVSRKENSHPFNRIIYFGYRRLLPNSHWLRFCGMSRKCCPKGYYEGNSYAYETLLGTDIDRDPTKHDYTKLATKVIDCCEAIGSNYWPETTERNKDVEIFAKNDFVEYCEPAHCDFRAYVQYQRREQSFYNDAADELDKKKANLAAGKTTTAGKKANPATRRKANPAAGEMSDKNKVNLEAVGVTGHSVYRELEASNNENAMSYDAFHAIKNFANDIINLLIGEEGCEKDIIEAMQLERRFLRITVSNKTKYDWEIPWLLRISDCEKADAALNSILIPVGMKQKFSAKNALKNPGYLKGVEKIQYLCAYMQFCLYFTDLKIEYKNLFALCAMVCSRIQSPRFDNVTTIDDLFTGTVEMLSLFECMLPDTVQKFTHHQLVDIVDSIKKFGPVRCWWTLSGERLIKSIKECVPAGGVNPLKTMYDKFVWKEKDALRSYHRDKSKWNNCNEFCDNATKLEGKGEAYNLSKEKEDFNEITYAVYYCMQISELDDKLEDLAKRSPFFLLYMRFRTISPSSIKFFEWLVDTTSEMHIFEDLGEVMYERVRLLMIELLQWTQITVYAKAYVSGIFHQARGTQWASNKKTYDIRECWFEKIHYSSWCKFTHWSFRYVPMKKKILYGQINYFFRINWINDTVVKDLSFASIFVPNSPDNDPRRLLNWRRATGDVVNCRFIPLYVIESTNVAVCGTSNGLPILVESTKDATCLPNTRYKFDAKELDRLYLIDMHPERSAVKCSFEESRMPEL